jgi:probable phosphoglycerate mutase
VRDRWPTALHAWYHQPDEAIIPDGESLAQLRSRGTRAVEELSARHAKQSIVFVGHTVINRIILLGVLGLGNERFWHIRQDTCAINVFEAEKGDFVLVSLNDTCHLHD